MSDTQVGQYHKYWKSEFNLASELLDKLPLDGKLEWSKNDYEAFSYKSEKVSLIFYPHTVKGT